MPRIIFKCGYIKNDPEHIKNLIEYVGTREGVEKLTQYRRNQPATLKQMERIGDILTRFPDSKSLFEYEDYQNKPTLENASAFITAAIDHNLDQLTHQEVYVNYIATRPRAEKLGSHGLFTDEDEPLVLSQVAEKVAEHTGNIWTPIISIKREDAVRLGYDNASAWIAILRQQRNIFAEQMKIAPENLRWYAAFHDESHHPHCHMIVYSVNSREGYVTKQAIEKMRSSLAQEIFQQDLLQIYSEQTIQRNTLTDQSRNTLRELLEQMRTGTCENPVIEDLMSRLAEKLKHTTGKKQYGYLQVPLKELVNQIVDELAKDERVTAAYAKWYELRNEVLHTYKDKLPEPLPLSQQKEFKQIKNMVIAEAVDLGNNHLTFEGDENAEPTYEEETVAGDDEPEQFLAEPEAEVAEDQDYNLSDTQGYASSSDSDDIEPGKPHVAWSDRYKEAQTYLYGSDDTEPDFGQALRLFLEEAEDGNALAMHDLGRMHADGLGVEIDADAAFYWYEKTLFAFMDIEAEKENRYIEYRIGKMHAAGLGTAQDYEEAAGWFYTAVSKNHKYAQYSLAGLYYRGQGVEQDYQTAFELYRRSARQQVPYAHYELAKMYRDGIGTARNTEEAELHFEDAFFGFQRLEEQSHDDKLQYRLGQMLYTGTGTEKDAEAAIVYFEKAARLGNVHAQYMLGKLYLDTDSGHENIEQAILWLTKAADNGNALAQYALGKLYQDGAQVDKDIQKAIALYTLSAEQDNSFAAYALGKLYLTETEVPKDIETAVKWLTQSAELGNQFAQYALAKLCLTGEDVTRDVQKALELFLRSAEQGNQYAQYQLGKLYLLGKDVPRDREAAVRWLTFSAEQGNVYAQFFLDHLDSFGNPSIFLTATRLLHHLGRIFSEEERRLPGGPSIQAESKLRRKIREKKIAQGHAPDDHEHRLTTY
jgi:TPR repeat protein